MFISNAGINSVAVDVVFAVFMALTTIAVLIVGAWLLIKFIGKDKNVEPKDDKLFIKIMALVLFFGTVLRVVFALCIKGYREDYDIIVSAMEHIASGGFKGYYPSDGIVLYPLTLFIYALPAVIANAAGLTASSFGMALLVKLPLIIADAVSAVILYRIASKYVNRYVGVIIAGMFMLSPVFMISSSVWGSVYSLLTLGLLLCMYFMVTKNFLGLFASYTASALIMKEALYLLPLFAVYIVYSYVKSLKRVLKEKQSAKEIWNDAQSCQVIRTPVYLVSSVLVAYLISLPTIIFDYGASFFGWIYRFALKPLADAAKFGYNSLGIFNIFAKNGDLLGANFPTVVFTVIFAVIILGITLLVYLSKKNRANLVFLSGYLIFTLATYYVDFGALTLVPVLAIFLMSFVLIKDRRILQVFAMLSLTIMVNAVSVLISAGYLNNASEYLFDSAFYTGTSLLDTGAGMAVSIICSVLTVLTHLYSTLILLDLAMSSRRKVLAYNSGASIGKSFALWMKP